MDTDFRLHDGRKLPQKMAWSKAASSGLKRGRPLIRLAGSYELRWRNYEEYDGARYGRFRYLVVRVCGCELSALTRISHQAALRKMKKSACLSIYEIFAEFSP